MQSLLISFYFVLLCGISAFAESDSRNRCDKEESCEKLLNLTNATEEIYWRACNCDRYCINCPYSERECNITSPTCIETIKGGIYMVAACPSDWEDPDTKELCESVDAQWIDAKFHKPVTSLISRVTYKNIFCQTCRSYDPSSNESIHVWIERALESGAISTSSRYVVKCDDAVIDRCSDDWTDSSISDKCDAYTYFVYAGQQAYKNPHCALCNGVSAQNLICWKEGNHATRGEEGEEIEEVEEEEEEEEDWQERFDRITDIILLCSIISIVFLCLHLISFILFDNLQDLNGKNLASLCVALILANFSMFRKFETVWSLSIEIISDYGYLASFFWIQVIAFDILFMLKLKSYRLVQGSRWKRFLIYSSWGWGAPACYMTAENFFLVPYVANTTFIQHHKLFKIQFCSNECQAWALLTVVPIAVIMVSNLTIFSLSAFVLYSSTKRRSRDVTWTSIKSDFVFYGRLAVLMGLSWIVGLIVGHTITDGLLYGFIASNLLQSTFIFLAFTCKEKVRNNIKNGFLQICKRRPEEVHTKAEIDETTSSTPL